MIIANLKGGLGNQMFQYARARARAKDEPVRLNVYQLELPAAGDAKRGFALDAFILGPVEIAQTRPSFAHKAFDKLMRICKPDWGYFQSERYFAEEAGRIRGEFALKAPSEAYFAWKRRIEEANTPVSVHVRRDDYAHNPRVLKEFGLCSEAYYESAARRIEEKADSPTYFVFSDDMEWARKSLRLGEKTVYVQDPALSDGEELALMSACMHNIIANSSFSWWGAWLNPRPDKIVVAPTPWFDAVPYNPHIIPASWIPLPKQ